MAKVCVVILILKMEEKAFGAYYALLFQEKHTLKNTTETYTIKMCAMYEEGAVTDGMCHKWFAKFCTGDFLLDDASLVVHMVKTLPAMREVHVQCLS